MFLRATVRKKDGKKHTYYSVVENERLEDGRVVQRHVLYLGEINSSQQLAWRKSIEVLDEEYPQSARTIALFPEDRCEAVVGEEDIVRLRLSQLRLERPRQWGGCWLALQLYRELALDAFWAERLLPSRKGTRWDLVLLILVVYRLLSPGSEWRLHRQWYGSSALADLLDMDAVIDDHALYDCHDLLLEHKAALFDHLVSRWRDLFNVSFEVLLYDLTSTYFEIDPPLSDEDKRQHGYSRDHRPDCVQVVIALVVTPQGFPLAYEVLAGNTADNTTLKDFLARIERQYGRAQRTWLMDRGIPTEAVLEQMRTSEPPVQYLVGTPKGRLSALEQALLVKPWKQVRPEVRVKLLPQDKELYVFAESCGSDRQGTQHAPPADEVVVGAVEETRDDEAHTRCAVDEARRRAEQDARSLAPGQHRDRRRRRLLRLLAQSQEATRGAPARRSLPAAYQPDRVGSGEALGVLSAVGVCRGGLQDAQRRSGHPPNLSSTRAAHRSAHLRLLPGVLPARDPRTSTEELGSGADHAQRVGKILRRTDDRCVYPHHLRPRAHPDPLHAA